MQAPLLHQFQRSPGRATLLSSIHPQFSPKEQEQETAGAAPKILAERPLELVTELSSITPTRTINNEARPVFNAMRQIIVPSTNSVPIELSWVDNDIVGETVADINSFSSDKGLRRTHQPNTGKIMYYSTEIGRSGQLITQSGSETLKQASLTFSISHEPVR